MANFFLDVSAIGNEYQVYADTPTTWGIPQDGNGKAGPGHAAAVAIATIDCNGATASGTGTVGVLGVTVSSTLNASGAALATAIVTAINASATATIATYSAALLPLNRLVFARVKPGVNTEVQIMLRIAGTDWNGMSPTRANITGGGVTAFAGGVDGPLAYLVNNTTVFGRVQTAYGALVQKPGSVTEPGADPILVRTRRSGTDLTTLITHTGILQIQHQTGLTERHLIFDNGTFWAGDNGKFLLETNQTSGASASVNFGTGTIVSNAVQSLLAMSPAGFKIKHSLISGNGAYGAIIGWGQGRTRLQNVYAEAGNSNTQLLLQVINTLSSNSLEAIDCEFVFLRNQAVSGLGSSTPFYQKLTNCTIRWNGIGSNIASLFIHSGFATSASASGSRIQHTNCKYIVDSGAYSVVGVYNTPLTSTSRSVTIIEGCIGISNPSIGIQATGPIYGGPELYWSDPATFSFRYEQCSFTTDYVQGNPYPTLSSQTPDGQPMCVRASWEVGRLNNQFEFEVTKVSTFYRDTTAVKTLALELLVPSTEVPNTSQIYFSVSYTDDTGARQTEHSRGDLSMLRVPSQLQLLADGVGLPNWSLNGLTGLSSKRLVLTTTQPVKQNSEVSCVVIFGGAPVGTHSVYIDPTVHML